MYSVVTDMLRAHPSDTKSPNPAALADCIEQCMACAQACTACADACVADAQAADLTACARTTLDCADMCETTSRVLTRRTALVAPVLRAVLECCLAVSRSCAAECSRHAETHEHCRICAEACRRVEQTCHSLLATLR